MLQKPDTKKKIKYQLMFWDCTDSTDLSHLLRGVQVPVPLFMTASPDLIAQGCAGDGFWQGMRQPEQQAENGSPGAGVRPKCSSDPCRAEDLVSEYVVGVEQDPRQCEVGMVQVARRSLLGNC